MSKPSRRRSNVKNGVVPALEVSALSLKNSEIQGYVSYSKGKQKLKTRYAFLNGNHIYFFNDDAGKRAKFSVNLKREYTQLGQIDSGKFSIQLLGEPGQKPVLLKLSSEQEFDAWNTSIGRVLHELQDVEGKYKAGQRRTENVLLVKIAEGKGLDGTLDTYVSIYTDDYQKNRTMTEYKQDRPIFDQEFDFVIDDNVQSISVCVKDENSKNILGQVTLPITELTDQNPHQHWFTLHPPNDRGLVKGVAHFTVSKSDNLVTLTLNEIANLFPQEIEKRRIAIRAGTETAFISFSEATLPHSTQISIPTPAPLDISVLVYETDKGNDMVLGYLNISLLELSQGSIQTSFLLRSTELVGSIDFGSIRCNLQFQQSLILEDNSYDDLLIALMANKMSLTKKLHSVSFVNEKVVAECLVKAFEVKKSGIHFLKQIVAYEVAKTTEAGIIFRGNTLATRSVDSYMRLTGEEYLIHVLQDVIYEMMSNPKKSCEMDIYRLDTSIKEDKRKKMIEKNLVNLKYYTRRFFDRIRESLPLMPMNFRILFEYIFGELIKQFPDDDISRYRGIGGFIFLRFFGPAILTPKAYKLIDEQPHPKLSRDLTLIAKTLQNAANLVSFGKKEPFMAPVNDFIHELFDPMKEYFNELCAVPLEVTESISTKTQLKFGREMSRVHYHLGSHLESMKENYPDDPEIAQFEQACKALDEKLVLSRHELNTGEALSSIVEVDFFASVS